MEALTAQNPLGGWRGLIFTLMLLNFYMTMVFKPKVFFLLSLVLIVLDT